MNIFPHPETESVTDILAAIEQLQTIQKTHRHNTPAWQEASRLLAPLFAEMARRQKCAS